MTLILPPQSRERRDAGADRRLHGAGRRDCWSSSSATCSCRARISLNWNFFTKLPKPVGETGGGMANAMLGSAKVLLLATLHRRPDRIPRRRLPGRVSPAAPSLRVRYVTDLLNGVPSIVIGIFAYTLIVCRKKHFSTSPAGWRWAS